MKLGPGYRSLLLRYSLGLSRNLPARKAEGDCVTSADHLRRRLKSKVQF